MGCHSWHLLRKMTTIYRECSVYLQSFFWAERVDGLVQEKRNSSALAMELCLSCTNPSVLVCNTSLWWMYTSVSWLMIGLGTLEFQTEEPPGIEVPAIQILKTQYENLLACKYLIDIKLTNTSMYWLEKDLINFKLYYFQKIWTIICQNTPGSAINKYIKNLIWF